MNVSFRVDLPAEVEGRLRADDPGLSAAAREGFALELFRRGELSHFALGQALGLDRVETDALLQRHGIDERGLTPEDLESDRRNLEQVLKTHGR
jgi:hypothetical protein